MQKKLFTMAIIVVLACIALTVGGQAATSNAKNEYQQIQLPLGYAIEDATVGDVTGDGINDVVFLMGQREDPDSYYSREHRIIVIDGASLSQSTLSLGPDSGGYEGDLVLGKVSRNKAQDILVGLPTGGSGGIVNYYLISGTEEKSIILAGPDALTEGLKLQVSLMDNFLVKVKNNELDKTYILDLKEAQSSANTLSEVYKDIYSTSGKLLKPEEGFVDPLSMVELRDIDGDGICELIGYNKIWVVFHANSIGIAKPVWKWADKEIKLMSLDVSLRYSTDDYDRELTR